MSTEKSFSLSSKGIVTVIIDKRSDKPAVKKAFESIYGVKVLSVRVLNTSDKKRLVKGKVGIKSGFKKAMVSIGGDGAVNFSKIS